MLVTCGESSLFRQGWQKAEQLCLFSCHSSRGARMSPFYINSHRPWMFSCSIARVLRIHLCFSVCLPDGTCLYDKCFLWCSTVSLGHSLGRTDIVLFLLYLVGHTDFRGKSSLSFVSMIAPGRRGLVCDFLQVYQYSKKDNSRIFFLLHFKLMFNTRGCIFS